VSRIAPNAIDPAGPLNSTPGGATSRAVNDLTRRPNLRLALINDPLIVPASRDIPRDPLHTSNARTVTAERPTRTRCAEDRHPSTVTAFGFANTLTD
jgi:hypothetical protein